MPLCNRMFCCIFGWYFYIEIRVNYETIILLSALDLLHCLPPLFCCLPLWKTVMLYGKKLWNATNFLFMFKMSIICFVIHCEYLKYFFPQIQWNISKWNMFFRGMESLTFKSQFNNALVHEDENYNCPFSCNFKSMKLLRKINIGVRFEKHMIERMRNYFVEEPSPKLMSQLLQDNELFDQMELTFLS